MWPELFVYWVRILWVCQTASPLSFLHQTWSNLVSPICALFSKNFVEFEFWKVITYRHQPDLFTAHGLVHWLPTGRGSVRMFVWPGEKASQCGSWMAGPKRQQQLETFYFTHALRYMSSIVTVHQQHHTLVANVMESPTRWLHGFIFRHDFEIIRVSSYKSCSRDYFYICGQQINVRKCSTNANCVIELMAICWKGVESFQQCTAP